MTQLDAIRTSLAIDEPARPPAGSPRVTVVIPTYNESANVRPLVVALRGVLDELDDPADHRWEIVFVDDSEDTTPQEVLALAETDGVPVRLVHRMPGQRVGGLGGAVLEGIRRSEADVVIVMDGDLQHPPETIPALMAAMVDHDVAVASRYVDGGSAGGLDGAARRFVSGGSTTVAKVMFPRRLRGCSDPMTGFFAVRRAAVRSHDLQPMGFKILLEILARHDLRIAEVPFTFGERHAGESKASLRQGFTFGWQLLNLRLGRVGRFAGVGATGLVLNLFVMAALLGAGVGYLAASLLATEVAIVSNFLLQERLVFADRAGRSGRGRRAGQSFFINNVEAVLRLPLLAVAVEGLRLPELVAQAVLIVGVFAARFTVMSRWVYRTPAARAGIAETVHAGIASRTPRTLTPIPVHVADLLDAGRTAPMPGSSVHGEAVHVDLDLVIPVLNEELRLGDTLEEIRRELVGASFRARVIVVDNGCTDATADVVDRMSDRLDLVLISCATRGKGAAVRRGILSSSAPYVAYCDADLSTPPTALHTGMELAAHGSSAVIGSRRISGSEVTVPQPVLRRVGSRAFNRVAVRLVGPVTDTQCGFKLLDGDLAREVFSDMCIDGYAFDVELIARLQRRHAAVVEMPVSWADNEGTRLRMTVDGVRAFRDLVAVRRAVGGAVQREDRSA